MQLEQLSVGTLAPPPQAWDAAPTPGGLASFREWISVSDWFWNCMLPTLELPRPFVLMICRVYCSQQMTGFLCFTRLLAFSEMLLDAGDASMFW